MVAKTTADILAFNVAVSGKTFNFEIPWDEVWFPSGECHDAGPLPGIDLKPIIVTLKGDSFDKMQEFFASNLQGIADASEKELSSSADSSEAGL